MSFICIEPIPLDSCEFWRYNIRHNATKVEDIILNYLILARFDIMNYFDILSLFNC